MKNTSTNEMIKRIEANFNQSFQIFFIRSVKKKKYGHHFFFSEFNLVLIFEF